MKIRALLTLSLPACLFFGCVQGHLLAEGEIEDGFVSLFNGEDLTNWVIPEGDNGHWKVKNGVIDYNADSESPGEKHLWSEQEFGDFILKIDWRIKETSGLYDTPIVLKDGSYLTDATGKKLTISAPTRTRGFICEGRPKPKSISGAGRPVPERFMVIGIIRLIRRLGRASTPRYNADKPVGEWNHFEIIMIGDRLTLLNNNHLVLENAKLPEVPQRGRFAPQHHGGKNPDGTYKPASSLVQFRNIWIKELPSSSESHN